MGVAITDLLKGKEIDLSLVSGKVLAIDAFNILYQFLTVLRGPDGAPLQNNKGEITSHLVGLLTRIIPLMQEGTKFIFVFDGIAPKLKQEERNRRKGIKEEAKKQYEIAKERNDFENMRKYASRMVSVNEAIINSTKEMLDTLGIPHIQAPSEGEAQAAYLVKNNIANYAVSQDADIMLFGSPNVIRNLSLSGKNKMRGKLAKKSIVPKLYSLEETLKELDISREQLIVLSILTGTDFNVGGIKGLGPKKSLKLVKEHGNNFEKIFEIAKWSEFFECDWKEIMQIFLDCPIKKDTKPEFNDPDIDSFKAFLEKYEFSEKSIENHIEKISAMKEQQQQKGLDSFF